MDMSNLGPAVRRALAPLLTQRLFYGAAIACAVGLGLGAWLKPPPVKVTSGGDTPAVVLPIVADPTDQASTETVDTPAPAAPVQPVEPPPRPTTVAALSPPADDSQPQPQDAEAQDSAPPPRASYGYSPRAGWADEPPDRPALGAEVPDSRDALDWNDPPPPDPDSSWRQAPREPPPDWDRPAPDDEG